MRAWLLQQMVFGSDVPRVLHCLYINGLEKGGEQSSEVTKSAVDTQLFKVVRMKADCEELHKDLKRLCDWAIK